MQHDSRPYSAGFKTTYTSQRKNPDVESVTDALGAEYAEKSVEDKEEK